MKRTGKKIIRQVKKYKYVLIVILVGIVLLLWPSEEKKKQQPVQEEKKECGYAKQTESRLCSLLGQISGAGRVEVMLTLAHGPVTEYQTDVQLQKDGERSSEDRKTVILSDGNAYDEAAVATVRYPEFQGALIVCDGAENAVVKWNILNAVSALTGLRSDQISVVKME